MRNPPGNRQGAYLSDDLFLDRLRVSFYRLHYRTEKGGKKKVEERLTLEVYFCFTTKQRRIPMSDSRRVYRGIKTSLRQLFPKQLNGHQARHLNTLSGMISGIVLNKQCHLEAMARKAPDGSKVESRIKRFSRCLQNEQVSPEVYYLPF